MERKTVTSQVRLAPTLKLQAEHVLDSIGLSPSSAIELFYKQIIAYKGLPFSPKVVNAATAKAMTEIKDRKGSKYNTAQELFLDLDL